MLLSSFALILLRLQMTNFRTNGSSTHRVKTFFFDKAKNVFSFKSTLIEVNKYIF